MNTLKQSSRVSVAVASSRVLGLVRESLFAALFGGGAIADAFQVAFRIPNLLRDLLAEGALSSAFVPTFTQTLTREGPDAARALARLMLGVVLMVTGLLTALGLVFAEPIVHAISLGFAGDTQKVALAVQLTRVMMPILALMSIGAVWMGVLNAQRRFMPPALAPLAFNAVSIGVGVVLVVSGQGADASIRWWSLGATLAGLAQAIIQVPSLWRLGYRPWPRLRGVLSHPGVRQVARLMAPAVLGLAAVQINVFVNTQFAASLGDGPVAQLSYAFRVFFLPIGVFSVALATVTTTNVAERAAAGDDAGLLAATREALGGVWLFLAGSVVIMVVLASPVVSLLFERGAFGPADTQATARVMQAYAIGLLPYGMVKVLAPVFYSVNRPRIPLAASISGVTVNLVFNAWTYRTLGAPGLALGTSLGAFANVAVLRWFLRTEVGALGPTGARVGEVLRVAVASFAMAGTAVLMWRVFAPWVRVDDTLARLWSLGLALAVTLATSGGVYFVVLVVLRDPRVSTLRRRLGRGVS